MARPSTPCCSGWTCATRLEALSSKHREVLELMLDEDLGQAQIAERLSIPVGTVKTRAFYGLPRAPAGNLEERGILA